ncbi:HYDIN [Symbiodinium natans]|uniref:HYDIN protein n=1 Tax=Symbiodinium natans TaxID=878477 RepID=A0A812FYA0_9DINO|nr:HYDIN [Symbiodinium natans]
MGNRLVTSRPPLGAGCLGQKLHWHAVQVEHYICNFGHIPLGQISARKINIHNCCAEAVSLFLDKKLLRENGFLVEPESIKPLAKGKSFMLQVSATRGRDEPEGTVELEWNLPVRGGPNYKIQLVADFVLPDLVLSTESIDFGRIIVGHRKRALLSFENNKAIPVEWAYVEPKSHLGRSSEGEDLAHWTPRLGKRKLLNRPEHTKASKGEKAVGVPHAEDRVLTASFAPDGAQLFTGTLQIRMRDNQRRKSIVVPLQQISLVVWVTGRGDVLRLEVRLVNPTDYPIEVFSTEFDEKYLAEERALTDYDGYHRGIVEVPLRQPGDGMWKQVAQRVVEVRKARKEEAEAAKAAKEEEEEGQPPPEADPEAEAAEARAAEELAALEAIAEQPDPPEELDASFYPYRVNGPDRVNAVLVGPPKSGMSTLARSLSKEDSRRVLKIDDVLDWVSKAPPSLHNDWNARTTGKKLAGGQAITTSEVAHLLKRRSELADCNTGVILDGLESQHLQPNQVLEAMLEAFKVEKVVLMTARGAPKHMEYSEHDLRPEAGEPAEDADAEDKAPAPEAAEGAVPEPPVLRPTVQAQALSRIFAALQGEVKNYIQELKAALPALEAAQKAAEDALAEVSAEKDQEPAEPGATLDPKSLETEEEIEAKQAAILEAKKAVAEAKRDLEFAQVDPEVAAVLAAQREAAQPPPSANGKAKSKAKPNAEVEEPPPPAEAYLELRDMAISTCERSVRGTWNAAAASGRPRKFPDAAAAEPIDVTAADFVPVLEDYVPPTEAHAVSSNLPKQRNLWSLAASLPLEDSVAVEIGFNAGHSSLLLLSAHPKLKVVAFDLCEHAYTKPCFDVLAAAFPGRLRLVPGKSQQTLPKWAADNEERALAPFLKGPGADLVHIDGDHDPAAARADLRNAKSVARSGAWVVFDDTCFSPLKAVWAEMLETKLISVPQRQFCATSRHSSYGIARYTPKAGKPEDLLWNLRPALEHRGRMRHVLVMAPTDHGQDSLLGYLSKHRTWPGKASSSKKLRPSTTERHQSHWISLPLRYSVGYQHDDMPCLMQLVAPHFADTQQITDCFPLVDGFLAVVDCAEGLTEPFCQVFGAAVARGLQPVLFLNKLDKLLSLETDNELCYQRLWRIVDRLNSMIEGLPSVRPLAVDDGSIVFGRGSLSVAESVGGWGFTLDQFLMATARRKAWTQEQVEKLRPRLWGDHFYNGRWGADGERGACKLVLEPVRGIFATLENPQAEPMARLKALPSSGLRLIQGFRVWGLGLGV